MSKKSRILALIVAVLVTLLCGCESEGKPRIGIVWRGDLNAGSYVHTVEAIEKAGGIPVLLDQVIADELGYNEKRVLTGCTDAVGALSAEAAELLKDGTWRHSNAKAVMKGISAVVFTGGEDISPSLYAQPQDWHGIFEEINYNATRDVSDYLLMQYCLDNDIPTLGICRGMQMMAVAAGAEMIQDIPAYFAEQGKNYDHIHRYLPGTPEGERGYAAHDVSVAVDSMAYRLAGMEQLTGCPSLHHQAVKDLDGTGFLVTGTTMVSGEDMIEIMEHPEMKFMLGIQFHPEAALGSTEGFMPEDTALAFFRGLVEAAG